MKIQSTHQKINQFNHRCATYNFLEKICMVPGFFTEKCLLLYFETSAVTLSTSSKFKQAKTDNNRPKRDILYTKCREPSGSIKITAPL